MAVGAGAGGLFGLGGMRVRGQRKMLEHQANLAFVDIVLLQLRFCLQHVATAVWSLEVGEVDNHDRRRRVTQAR